MKVNAKHSMKFLRLKKRLKLPDFSVVGILESLWLFTQGNAPLGDIGKFSNEDIAMAIDWQDDHDLLVTHLIECGWLDACPIHRIIVHDWAEHCPTFIRGNVASKGLHFAQIGIPFPEIDDTKPDPKGGRQSAKPPTKPPAKPHTEQTAKHDTEQTAKPPAKQGAKPPTTYPILSYPIQANPSLCEDSPVSSATKTGPTAEPDPGGILVFPTRGKAKQWHLQESHLADWSKAYPEVDVLAECRKALAWINANRPKTANGMARFLNSWMSRANDRPRSRDSPNSPQNKPTAGELYQASIDLNGGTDPLAEPERN